MNPDLEACREKVLLLQKTATVTRDCCFAAYSVASSMVDEAAPRTIVRISDILEERDFQCVREYHMCDLRSGN